MRRGERSWKSTRRTLRRAYRLLLAHFGPQQWWPGRTRFEVVLGALLTQNTSWSNVEKALRNLRRLGLLSLPRLRELEARQLPELLRPSGTFRRKTRVVLRLLRHLARRHQGSLHRMLRQPPLVLRGELLGLAGIGEETADSILLYAARHPHFVIDAYTRRILERHGWALPRAPYRELQAFFHRHLPPDSALYNEYHALLVAAGKTYCHRREPDCPACPLGGEGTRIHGRT